MIRKQTWALWVGVALVGLLLIVPPWKFSFSGAIYREQPGPLLPYLPPAPARKEKETWSVRLDTKRMIVPVVLVAIVTGALLVTLRDKK